MGADNVALVEALRDQFSDTITFIEEGAGTCGTYAFGVFNDPAYRAVALELDVFAGKRFFAWVITRLDEVDSPVAALCLLWLLFAAPLVRWPKKKSFSALKRTKTKFTLLFAKANWRCVSLARPRCEGTKTGPIGGYKM